MDSSGGKRYSGGVVSGEAVSGRMTDASDASDTIIARLLERTTNPPTSVICTEWLARQ